MKPCLYILLVVLNSDCLAYSEIDLAQFYKTNSCIKCDLSELEFIEAHPYALLSNSNLSYCKFKARNFDFSNFSGAQLIKSKSVGYNIYGVVQFRQSDLTNANLTYSFYRNADFSGSNFENANLKHVDFEEANLSDTNFERAITDKMNLKKTILIGSNITLEQLAKAASISCAILPDGEVAKADNGGTCSFR